MKKIRFAAPLIASLVACVALSSCEPGDGGPNAVIWSADSMTKIARNLDWEDKSNKVMEIEMLKNESEGAQLMINALDDIGEYTVSVSELKSKNAILPADCVEIYHEKYIQLSRLDGSGSVFDVNDWIPDALLPYQKAVEYHENSVKKGENQGVYIEITTTEETIPGTYCGLVTLQTDACMQEMPIRVIVRDITLPSNTNVTNYWGILPHWFSAWEMDGTTEMFKAYIDFGHKYNMNSSIPFECGTPEEYAQLVKEYWDHDGFSTYVMYFEATLIEPSYYNGKESLFDGNKFKEFVKAIARLSVEDEVNYLSRAFSYFYSFVDEPGSDEGYQRVKEVMEIYEMVLKDADSELKLELLNHKNYGFYLQTMSDAVLDLPYVIPETIPSVKDTLEQLYGVYNVTHCTTANFFSNAALREKWDEDEEDWWFYTCCVPLYPYPTNFIEDGLLGMKLISWMQYVYDIGGYLNWSACVNINGENPYENPDRGFVQGDGYMFYPGAPYGIYGPVASLRAVAYRDGTEDYDLMCVLEEKYAKMGLDAHDAIEGLFNVVCSGTVPTTNVELYKSTKKELVNLALGLADEYGVVFGKTTFEYGVASVEVAPANSQAEIYYNGEKMTPGENGLYVLTIDLKKSSELRFTVKTENGEKEISKALGETFTYFGGFEDGNISLVHTNQYSATSLNENAEYVLAGDKSLKISFNGLEGADHTPYICFNDGFVGQVDVSKLYRLEFSVYNSSDREIELSFQGFTGTRYLDYGSVVLKKGWNNVQFSGICLQADAGAIKAFYLMSDNFWVDGGIDLYIDEIYYSVQ